MKNFLRAILIAAFACGSQFSFGQCTIDTTNTHTGFTPATPAVVKPGVAYAQTVQVHVPATYSPYTVDSLHIDSITGMPSGITYVFNPASGTVLGGQDGAICYSGVTNDSVGPYPLTFYGFAYTSGGAIPFSYLVTLSPSFGYKFRVETAPVAAFTVDSPVCTIVDSVTFKDLTGGYPTGWAWTFQGGSPATSTHQYPVVYYDSAGTYTVTLAARNGISSDTITQTVTVNPSVSATVSTTPATSAAPSSGTAAIAVSGGTPPFSFYWSNGATTDSVSNLAQGGYLVTVTDAKGCQYVNASVNISFINGVLQLSNTQQVKIYPNPATDVLNLSWSEKSNAAIAIIDINGNTIRSFTSNGVNNNVYDVHDLAAGTYLIRITDKTSNKEQSVLFSKL